jgi:hypothetical protein
MDYTYIAMIVGAVLLTALLIGLVVYFTMFRTSSTTKSTKLTEEDTKKKQAQDCMNLFVNKLKSFAKTTKDVDSHSITGEVTDYNHFCQAIDSGISVNCPDLQVSMALFNLPLHYYEGLRPEPVTYKAGQMIEFENKDGTLKPPDEFKLKNCRGIPRDAVFRFVLKHGDIEEDIAFDISIPDFLTMGSSKVTKMSA